MPDDSNATITEIANWSQKLKEAGDAIDEVISKMISVANRINAAKRERNTANTWMTPEVEETCRMATELDLQVSSADIRAALKKADARLHPMMADRNYYAVPMEVWQRIIDETHAEDHKYISERRDCDDFAKYFWALVPMRYGINGVGMVLDYRGKHAYNVLLVRDGRKITLKWFEPQTDKFVELKDGTMYTGKGGRVLF